MKDWIVVYGKYSTEEKHALNKITAYMQNKLNYVFATEQANDITNERLTANNSVIIGTPNDNKYIKKLIDDGFIDLPAKAESYAYAVLNDVFAAGLQTIVVAGSDAKGVLYGVSDLLNEYFSLTPFITNNNVNKFSDAYALSFFDIKKQPFGEGKMPLVKKTSSPSVKNRALWTWAHCVYDYKKYFENMATLKLNKVVLWTDELPVNAADVVDYAHSLGIKVIWGYAWGWDNKITVPNYLSDDKFDRWANGVLLKYENEFKPTGADGIYFQSFTETYDDLIGGMVIAEVVSSLVEKVSKKFYDKYPNLEIQFGLHGTSVKNHLEHVAKVNEKTTIVWEDLGAFPFAYNPDGTCGFDDTVNYVKKAATLRGKNDKFGAVFKGMTKLDWNAFIHQKGRYVLGESDRNFISARAKERAFMWKIIDAQWLKNAEYVKKTLDAIRAVKGENFEIQALVEDGVFEEKIPFAAALFAELLWDDKSSVNDIVFLTAAKPDVNFINSESI